MSESRVTSHSSPGPTRQLLTDRPWWVDSALASAYWIYGVFGVFIESLATGVSRPAAQVVVSLIVITIASAAVLLRRSRPWSLLIVQWAAALALLLVDSGLDPIGVSIALYALAVYRANASAWIGFAASVAACGIVVAVSLIVDTGPVGIGPAFIAITLIATLLGANTGNRRRYVSALIDRAERLEVERDQQALIAAAAERARITREMHDVVAHSISIMVALSDGADALATKEPERSRDAVRETSVIGRRALADMRALLSRGSGTGMDAGSESSAPLDPQPGASDLHQLISTFRSAGLPVDLEVVGRTPDSAALQTATYRIVQEALTNALRYAAKARRVVAHIDHRAGVTTVSVTDDGQTGAEPTTSVGTGNGLIGMRERAAIFGGTMVAGPLPAGGWAVEVTLPDPGANG
ncbi:sensor histidine kinase [Marisediminicola sp. LYQ134]|uniref:sensor histidine kinase n=1 Tax=Marisediminicola sp. LYQ134 TaxID=3391061 RepID=UPI003983532D